MLEKKTYRLMSSVLMSSALLEKSEAHLEADVAGPHYPLYTSVTRTTYPRKEYNTTSYFPYICFHTLLFGAPYYSQLIAEPESATFVMKSIYGTNTNRVIYG